MTEDIGAELYELIHTEFERRLKYDVQLIGLTGRIKRGMAKERDISVYASRLGSHLRAAIEHYVSADKLPNGQMYYNIAEKILRPSMQTNYELFNKVAAEIQESIDKKNGIRIKPQQAEFPKERIDDMIGAASEMNIPKEKMLRRMTVTAENITRSFADDYAKVNADFRSRAGLKTYIIRRDDGDCCEWCANLAGKYRYPDEVPKDVYRRHDNCGCLVEQHNDGTVVNVHSKRSGTDEQQKEWLKELDGRNKAKKAKIKKAAETAKKPKVFSPKEADNLEAELKTEIKGKLEPEEAERLEKELLQKRAERLTGGAESGIINIDIDEFVPCLKDVSSGEILETEVRSLSRIKLNNFKESNGWGVDWIKRPARENVLGVFIKGENEPQGLISLRKDNGGIYIGFASAAPQNNKMLNGGKQKYIGVGGHLFAAAVEESLRAGNKDGCIWGYAANEKLLEHYITKFGAEHLPITHEYQFVIEGEAAKKLIDTYNYERR